MSSENKFLLNLSERLGLDKHTFKKAEEFFRVLQNKSSFSYVNDIAKGVLCLDIAASTTGVPFDNEIGLKLSGLKKQMYTKCLNTGIQLLNLETPQTIPAICVQNSCTEVKDFALEILQIYKESHTHLDDLDHPQYNSVAVYTACKIKGIKVSKKSFQLASRLTLKQFNKLESQFETSTKDNLTVDASNLNKCTKKIETHTELIKDKEKHPTPKKVCKPEEDYETWRNRILAEATMAISS